MNWLSRLLRFKRGYSTTRKKLFRLIFPRKLLPDYTIWINLRWLVMRVSRVTRNRIKQYRATQAAFRSASAFSSATAAPITACSPSPSARRGSGIIPRPAHLPFREGSSENLHERARTPRIFKWGRSALSGIIRGIPPGRRAAATRALSGSWKYRHILELREY